VLDAHVLYSLQALLARSSLHERIRG
jgi:hypothetical protein